MYRFVCPDGRSYIGSRKNIRGRERQGIGCYATPRLLEAFEQHPPETWKFEILEMLTNEGDQRAAEQRHIERLHALDPAHGFNMIAAHNLNYRRNTGAVRAAHPSISRFLTRDEVFSLVGESYPALWSWMKSGQFPLPRVIGKGERRSPVRWLESEVAEWMASRAVRRPKGMRAEYKPKGK